MKNIGEELKSYFRERGITQEELAETLGVSQPYINALFNNSKKFGKKQAQKWNELFGISVNFLLTGEGSICSDHITRNNQNGDNINGHSVTVNKTEVDYIEIIKAQSNQLLKSQEQIDELLQLNQDQFSRLMGVIEKLTK